MPRPTSDVGLGPTPAVGVAPAAATPAAAAAPPAAAAFGSAVATRPAAAGVFRPDVEGLRAVAIVLVMLYHLHAPGFGGGFAGVDVFFVISGFVITTHLLAELGRTGRISLVGFYARRARRILPAAAVVLVAAAVVTWLGLPHTYRRTVGGDIVASAVYVVNWRIKDRLIHGTFGAPFQTPLIHFWSLAVEEQFYLVWPLLLLSVGLLARLARRRVTAAVAGAIAVVAIGSLAWSVLDSAHSPTAYYSIFARMWELALGGGVAVAAPALARLPRAVAAVLGWIGLAMVVAAGPIFSDVAHWPGYQALLPTVGAAAVIVAGSAAPLAAAGARGGPGLILATRPARWVGRLSYSLYLWHAVLLYGAIFAFGNRTPLNVAAVALAVPIAWLSYVLVENPVRRSPALARSPGRTLGLACGLTLVGVVTGLAVVASG